MRGKVDVQSDEKQTCTWCVGCVVFILKLKLELRCVGVGIAGGGGGGGGGGCGNLVGAESLCCDGCTLG